MNLHQVQVVDPDDQSNVMTANLYIPSAPSSNQATIVMLPFWGGYADIYKKVQTGLAEALPGNASIAISYRGTGAAINKDLDVDHRQWAISLMSANFMKFLRSEAVTSLVDTSRLILVGHSWAAKLCYSVLIRDAPKANVDIVGLLFLGPSPPTPIVLEAEDRAFRRGAYDSFDTAQWTISNVLTHQKLTEEESRGLAQNMVAMSTAAKKSWIEVGIWEDWTVDVTEFAARTPKKVPVHVIAADHDNVEPHGPVEKQTVEFLRGLNFPVTSEVLEECGHLIQMERPDAVVAAVKTLATVPV